MNSNQRQFDNMLDSLKKGIVPTGQLAASAQRGNENTFISVVATQLLRAKQKQLQVAELFTPESRDYISAEEMVKDLTKKFENAIIVEMDGLKAKKTSLEQSLKEKREQLQQLEEKSEDARRLQLAVTVAKERYLQFGFQRGRGPIGFPRRPQQSCHGQHSRAAYDAGGSYISHDHPIRFGCFRALISYRNRGNIHGQLF